MDESLKNLRLRIERAMEAECGEAEKTLVWGEGPLAPALLLVGEAPGLQESEQGRPFVGPAGKKLNALLEDINLSRERLYVTNTVKYRPTQRSKAGRTINRTPTKAEVALFSPWLLEEIRLVSPGLIATLGNVALGALMGQDVRIGDLHGRLLRIAGLPAPLFPLYHPASILYNPVLRTVYEEDLLKLRALLADENDI